MDLTKLNTGAPEGAVMPLRHPVTKQPIMTEAAEEKDRRPVTFTVISRDAKALRKASFAFADQRVERARKKDDASPGAEVVFNEERALIARCVVGWENVIFNGDELSPTHENVVRVFDALPWVQEQVEQFASDRANFLKASSPIS